MMLHDTDVRKNMRLFLVYIITSSMRPMNGAVLSVTSLPKNNAVWCIPI